MLALVWSPCLFVLALEPLLLLVLILLLIASVEIILVFALPSSFSVVVVVVVVLVSTVLAFALALLAVIVVVDEHIGDIFVNEVIDDVVAGILLVFALLLFNIVVNMFTILLARW